MKHSVRNLLFGLGLFSTLNLQPSPCFAQGTALTYQGLLSQNGAVVNGASDLTFTLYSAASGGATVGASNVVNDLVTTNGLFTVTLDFGAGAFDGSARWLQIAVRPGASTGAYTNLTPRQPITATPYAIYAAAAATAGSASSVAGSNITGTIDDGRLSANVARLNVGNTFSESQTIRSSAGGLVISSSTGGQFGSGTLRVQGNTGLGTDPRPDHRLAVNGTVIASGFVGNGSELANVDAATFTGQVADSQLSANIARRTNGNTFTGNQIISNGNVGIGTSTPKHKLDVDGNIFLGTAFNGQDFTELGDTLYLGASRKYLSSTLGAPINGSPDWINLMCHPLSQGILFGTAGPSDADPHSAPNPLMVIQSGGNVGIGTNNPTSKLEVAGNARVNGKLSLNTENAANATVIIQAGADDNFPLQVYNQSGNTLLQLTTDASAGGYLFGVFGNAAKSQGGNTWTVFSDERLKQHIRPYEHGLDAILKLRTKRFEYIDDPVRRTTSGHEEIGLIAQQVEGIIPEAVSQGADGYRTLNASPVYWAAINAIQELNGKVEVQRQANAKLQEQNQSLEQRVAALEKLINRLSVTKEDAQ